jgi:transcriptional regulator with XRE-family HTH domain
MSQQAAASAVGCSISTLQRVEHDEGSPQVTTLAALAKLYGVSMDELLLGTEAR